MGHQHSLSGLKVREERHQGVGLSIDIRNRGAIHHVEKSSEP